MLKKFRRRPNPRRSVAQCQDMELLVVYDVQLVTELVRLVCSLFLSNQYQKWSYHLWTTLNHVAEWRTGYGREFGGNTSFSCYVASNTKNNGGNTQTHGSNGRGRGINGYDNQGCQNWDLT